MSELPKRCPYCGQTSVSTESYIETSSFGDYLVTYHGEREVCHNPSCTDPIRYLPYQWKSRERQRAEQLGEKVFNKEDLEILLAL